jgi:hypothetical protein
VKRRGKVFMRASRSDSHSNRKRATRSEVNEKKLS